MTSQRGHRPSITQSQSTWKQDLRIRCIQQLKESRSEKMSKARTRPHCEAILNADPATAGLSHEEYMELMYELEREVLKELETETAEIDQAELDEYERSLEEEDLALQEAIEQFTLSDKAEPMTVKMNI